MDDEPVPITEALKPISMRTKEGGVTRGRKSMNRCKHVFIDSRDRGKQLPYWSVVRRGVIGGVRFLYAVPQPCLLVPSTRITYSDSCEYSFREAESNVIIEEDCGTGKKHVYAYPKNVWRELHDFYVEPMVNGREPYNVGVILMGPPGTGKSKLAQIIAKYAGLNLFKIDTTILSKWVGESENRLREAIDNARASQPSIIILDDAEWILASRRLSGGETESGTASVRLNLQQILFSSMQEIYDRGERVLFVATTNVKQEALDPALVRHGRFGPPIFVPLPDLEAAKIIVREVLPDKPEEEIERIAFAAVNAGLSAADTIALAERVRRGGEPRPRTVGGRGYNRIFVDKVTEFERLEHEFMIPLSSMLSSRSRLSIYGNEDVASALAVQMAYAAKRTVIKLVDPRHIDEAVHSANMLGSVFIAPTRLHHELQYYIHDNADVSVVFVGTQPPSVPTFNLGDVTYIISRVGVRAAVKAVAALKGLKASEGLLRKIERKSAGDYNTAARILEIITTTSVIDEEHLERMLAWVR